MKTKWLSLVMAAALSAPVWAAEAPLATGEMLAGNCAGCHGTQGRQQDMSIMPLVNISKQRFVQTMMDYRSGKRPSTLMGHIAKGYSEAEIELIAEYFVQLGEEVSP